MLIAVGATNNASAAAVALPASTTAQKYRICLKFIFFEAVLKNQCLISVELYLKLARHSI
jgi:hypothetical protein